MNRQQRRLSEKMQGKKRSYTDEEMHEICEKYAKKRIEMDRKKSNEVEIELYFTAFGLALEELHGFKMERILNVWKKTDEYISKIPAGECTFEDLKNMLYERANIICSFE